MAQRTGQVVRTPAPPVTKRVPGTGNAVGTVDRRPRRDVVETVWVLFCSLRFAVVLNVALALFAMLGTVVPQMPPGIQNFEAELNSFMDTARGRYGDVAGLMHWAGAFDLYNSLPFRMLVVLVVFGIVICTLNRWQPITRMIRKPAVRVSEGFLAGLTERAQFRAVPLSTEAAEGALRQAFKKSRYRVLAERSGDGTLYLYADRDRWSKLVTFASHAALVMLILTAAGMANFGWREQSVFFYPGQPVNVGHGTDFSVRHEKFAIDYYPDGKTVKEYRDTLAVVENGRDVLTKTIIVNDPLRYKGINFFLVSYQPVLYLSAAGSDGKAMPMRRMGSQGVVTDTVQGGATMVDFKFQSQDNLPMDLVQLPAPDHILTLELTYYQDVTRADNENPPVYVRAYVDKDFDKRIYDAFLPRTGDLKLPGFEQYTINFKKDMATVLEVANDPGMVYGAFWFFVMAAGFTISLYTSFTRAWARIRPSEEQPGSVDILVGGLAEKNKVSFEKDFTKMAGRLKDALVSALKPGARKDAVEVALTSAEQAEA